MRHVAGRFGHQGAMEWSPTYIAATGVELTLRASDWAYGGKVVGLPSGSLWPGRRATLINLRFRVLGRRIGGLQRDPRRTAGRCHRCSGPI
jgi:hypothetical protein